MVETNGKCEVKLKFPGGRMEFSFDDVDKMNELIGHIREIFIRPRCDYCGEQNSIDYFTGKGGKTLCSLCYKQRMGEGKEEVV